MDGDDTWALCLGSTALAVALKNGSKCLGALGIPPRHLARSGPRSKRSALSRVAHCSSLRAGVIVGAVALAALHVSSSAKAAVEIGTASDPALFSVAGSDPVGTRVLLNCQWRIGDSNPWPLRCDHSALPAELIPRLQKPSVRVQAECRHRRQRCPWPVQPSPQNSSRA